jgi:hypothetical protein
MAAINDITGDAIKSKSASQKYYDNYDAIFGKKDKKDLDKPLTTDYNEDANVNTEQSK